MGNDNGEPSDKGNGAALDSAAIEKLINDTVGKALAARLPRVKNTEETLAKMVSDAVAGQLAKLAPEKGEQPANTNDGTGEQRLTMKALQEKIDGLTKALQDRDKAIQEAEQRTIQTRVQSDVRGLFAKHLGADSPHLNPYASHYLNQFVDIDGQTYLKKRDAYGQESVVPAQDAVNEWFTKGDLKHLVTRTQQLPSTVRPQFGQPLNPQVPQGGTAPQGQQHFNSPLAVFAQGLAEEGRTEAAEILLNDAAKIAQQPHRPVNVNGNSK